jgi:hypothetical protein
MNAIMWLTFRISQENKPLRRMWHSDVRPALLRAVMIQSLQKKTEVGWMTGVVMNEAVGRRIGISQGPWRELLG